MKQILKYTGYILAILIAGYLIYRFYYIIIWVLIAAMVSFIGAPLVRFFDRIRIRKLKMPRLFSAVLTLLIIIIIGSGFIAIFVPLIIKQAQAISSIDFNILAQNLKEPLAWIDEKLHILGAIPYGETFQDFLIEKIKSLLNFGNLSTAIGKFISVAGDRKSVV